MTKDFILDAAVNTSGNELYIKDLTKNSEFIPIQKDTITTPM